MDWTAALGFPERPAHRTLGTLLVTGVALSCALPNVARADTPAVRGPVAPVSLEPDDSLTAGATKPVLLGVRVLGATVISADRIADVYTDKLAKPVDIEDVAEIAERITAVYRQEGYFLSQAVAGPQDLSTGIASITVFEGRISRVTVEGDRADILQPTVNDLANSGPAKLSEIDARLARMREIPGLRVTSQVRPDPDDPGAHELVLDTRFDTDRVFAGLNNWGWERSGPVQAYATYVRNSLLQSRDQVSLNLFTTPGNPEEFTQLGAGYSYGFKGGSRLRSGLTVSLSGQGFDPAGHDPGGESISTWARYERPLSLRRSQSVWFIAGLDIQHKENNWISGGGYKDELRVVRSGLRGTRSIGGTTTRYNVMLSGGLDILGASGPSAINRSRYDADAKFVKLDGSLSHYRDIGKYFGLYTEVSGQFSDEPLLLSEEFTVGGADLGRAYRYGELSGDRGLAAMVELRAGYAPESDLVSFLQGYTFYDAGSVWNADPAGWDRDDLSSAGLGMRISFLDSITARLELAKPLTRTPYDEEDRDWRQFFQLSVAY